MPSPELSDVSLQPEINQQPSRGFPAFYEQYGQRLGLNKRQSRRAWNSAQQNSAEYQYHNFQHHEDTLWAAMELVDLCEQNGESVNRVVLFLASLLHDAAFDKDYTALGFDSAEALSANIYRNVAAECGLAERDIELGSNAITATKRGNKPETLEAKILVRADLSNIFGEYSGFSAKTNLLWQEYQMLSSNKSHTLTYAKFLAGSVQTLLEYVSNDLSLGDFDTSNWSLKAISNMQRQVLEHATAQGLRPIVWARKELGRLATSRLFASEDEPEDKP